MNVCRQCGHDNPDWAQHCVSCKSRVVSEAQNSQDERGHLEYLLAHIPRWRSQGIIPPGSASRLREAALRRLAELQSAASPPPVPPVFVQQPPQLPQQTSSPDAQPTTQEPHPDRGPTPGLAEFFEAHWIKLLALLSAAFILAGMRQVLGDEWIARLAPILLPLVPMAMAAGLIRWVLRSDMPESIAARTCGGIGIVLVAFAVAAVNRYWLAGLITPVSTLLLSALAGALAGAGLARRDSVYLHYTLGLSALATPFLVLAGSGGAGLGQWLPYHGATGLAAIGVVYLSLGLASRPDGRTAVKRSTLMTWGSGVTSGAAAFAALQVTMGDAHMTTSIGVLLICSASSGVAGRLSESSALAAVSVVASALAAYLLIPDMGYTNSLTWGYLAIALGVTWSAAALSAPGGWRANPATVAYGMASLVAFGMAGLMVALHALECVGNGISVGGPGWERVAVLSGACAGAYASVAVLLRQPRVVYAVSGAVGLAVGVTASALFRLAAFEPMHHAGHDMAVASAVVLAAGTIVARFTAVRRPGIQESVPHLDWTSPWLHTGSLVAASCMVTSLGWTQERGVDAGTWWAVGGATLATGVACVLVRRAADPVSLQVLLAVFLAGLVTLCGLVGFVSPLDVGTGAALLACAWITISAASLDRISGSVAALPLRSVGLLAYLAATLALVSFPSHAGANFALHRSYLLAAATMGFAVTVAARRAFDPILPSMAAVTLGQCWLWRLVEPSAGLAPACTVASAVSAIAYGRMSRYETTAAPWLSAITAALGWYGSIRWIGAPLADWTALAMLPGLVGMYALSEASSLPDGLRPAMRRTAVAVLLLTISLMEIEALLQHEAHPRLAATHSAFALASLAATVRRSSANWAVLTSTLWSLTAAHGLYMSEPPLALWALGFVACSLPFALVVVLMRRSATWAAARRLVGGVGAFHVGVGAWAGLIAAPGPNAGTASVMAIVLAGIFLSALYASGLGGGYAHLSAACFLTAHALFLFSRVNIHAGVLDLYLIPVGAYLLILGHLADRRAQSDKAPWLWWTGVLMVMTPTFLAFWIHFTQDGPAWHAVLLVAQCIAAVLWGIAHRIRAFVVTGGAFALAFAATLGSASVQEFWIGLVALIVGLLLLGAVVQLSTRAEATRAWAYRTLQEWRRWR